MHDRIWGWKGGKMGRLGGYSALVVLWGTAGLVLSGCAGQSGSGSSQENSAADATTTAADAVQASEDALDAALEKSFKESGAPGVVAAVQTPEYTWVRALGVADRTSGEPMTPDVHHRIGSITKTFTITLLLQAEGLLSLDDTIDRYVEGVPNGDKITLRQMANHTSGIANYLENKQFLDEFVSDPKRIWTPEELAQVGIEDSPLFDPGTDFHYSNTNTILLGLVLEQVSGEPIGELYRERIIEPLGLQGTSFSEVDPSIPDPHVRGYTLYHE
jgi:D-alanyl-D-alanine carboxypeptidase